MTVQTNTNVASFNGNGVTQIFPIAFKFNNDTDLIVLLVDDATGAVSQLTLNSDYTVSGEGDEEGGLINVVVAPALGQRLKVTRVVDILQLTDLRNQGKFFAEVHEDAFDLLTMIAQQHQSDIALSLRVAETDPEPARIPSVAQRAGKLLAFDADGNPTTALPVADSSTELRQELAEDTDPAKNAGMIGFDPALGYASRTVGGSLAAVSNATVIAQLSPALSDYSAEINAFAATLTDGKTGQILPGIYPCASKITFPKDAKLLAEGVVFDFSAAAAIGDFPGAVCVEFGGGSLIELASPSVAPTVGGYTLTFAAAPAVASDDVLFIWNDAPGSWSGFRDAYTAGEAVVVRALSGSDVLLNSALLESYSTSVRVFKLSPTKPKCVGLEVRQPTGLAVTGIYTTLSRQAEFHKIKATQSGVAGLTIDRSIGFTVTASDITSDRSVLVGDNYGLSISNSQWGLVLGGRYEARRHAVTMGGTSLDASIPTRFVKVQGTYMSSWDVQCADMHGNVEFCSYDGCTMLNGVTISGNNNAVRNSTIYAPALAATGDGVAISINEAKGTNFEFTSLIIRANGNPQSTSRGVIDFGGNSSAMNANTTLGGTLLLADITLYAPNAKVPFDIVNNGSTATDKELVVRNFRWVNPPAGRVSSGILSNVSGTQFARADLNLKYRDAGAPAGMSIAADKISGLSESGTTAAVSVAAATQDIVITFNNRFPKAPSARCSINVPKLGVVVASTVVATTVSTMTVRVYSTGGAAMTAGSNYNISWSAVLDE